MSFSKAKINRYYDDLTCAPPPGKYDPKFETIAKTPSSFERAERFNTPSKMVHAASLESIESTSSWKTPIFRTPSKRAGKAGVPSSTPKSKLPLPNKIHPNKLMESDSKLINEINELTRVHQVQLVEKNEEVAQLIEEINGLNRKMADLLSSQATENDKRQYEKEINKLTTELKQLQDSISENRASYTSHVESLQSKISNLEENLSNHIAVNKQLEDSLNTSTTMYEEINRRVAVMAEDFSSQFKCYVQSLDKLEHFYKSMFEDYERTLDILRSETEDNLENKRLIMGLQTSLDVCKDELETANKQIRMYTVVQAETSKTVNILSKRLTEREMEIDQLSEVHRDLLKRKASLETQVQGLSTENQLIKDSFECLQQTVRVEMETMQLQLVEKVESYKQLAVEESEKQKVCLEEKQKTIDMLLDEISFYKTKKEEDEVHIDACKAQIAKYKEEAENLRTAMEETEHDFEEKIGAQKALLAHLSQEYESLEKESSDENNKLKDDVSRMSSLLAEKDILEKKQMETIQLLEYEKMSQAVNYEEFVEQKDELLKIIERQEREIKALSETADGHYSARKALEGEISKLQEEKELLKDSGQEDSMKVTSLEARVADLECRNRELNEIIGPFKSQLMQYELERSSLLSKSQTAEKELRLLELEHAKILGHQNHKQKIKHIVNLNENIATLKKEVEKYRLESLKLKQELLALKPSSLVSDAKKNKENRGRGQRERNISPAAALKDRNG